MEPPYGAIFLLFIVLGFAGVVSIFKARQRREKTYYLVSIVAFIGVFAVAVALLNQFVLSFAILIVAGLMSLVLLPRVMELYGQEIVKQKHETDVSTPLRIRDFLTWKGWIKLKAIYGFRKMITIYSILNIGAVAALLLVLTVLGIITPVMAIWYSILTAIVSIIIVYRQIWKAFKEI